MVCLYLILQVVHGNIGSSQKVGAVFTLLHHGVFSTILVRVIRHLCWNGPGWKCQQVIGLGILFRGRHYAAVVATEGSFFVLVGMAKFPEGLLTQILVPMRDFILLNSVSDCL